MQIGIYGSPVHVLTNDRVQDKKGCLKAIGKDALKDTAKIGGITLGTAAAASLVTGNSKKVSGFLSNMKNAFGGALDKVSVKMEKAVKTVEGIPNPGIKIERVSLKEIIKNNKFVKKLNSLPTPAKAGLVAGGLALMIVGPIISLASAAKAGSIEAKYEEK